MRTVFRFLTLLLCFELVIGPMNSSLSLIGQKAFAETCGAGMSFDTVLNRCLTTTETANVMNATASCNGDVNCYKENAQKAFQEKVNKGDAPERKGNNQFVSTVAGAAAIAGPVTLAAAAMSTGYSTCMSPSFWTMIAGSAALFGGDLIANMQHKSRLKKIKADWGKIVNPEDAKGDKDKIREANSEAQSQAFEMLARSEDSLVKAAKTKRNLFLIASLAYAASAVYAYGEIATMKTLGLTGAGAIFLCPKATSIKHDRKESLYAYYSSATRPFIYSNTQTVYNLKNSPNIESLIVNQMSAYTDRSPTIDEYNLIKDSFQNFKVDRAVLQIIKDFTVNVISNMSPFAKAYAQEVQTNAAKSYKEDDGKSSNLLLTMGLSAAMVAAVFAVKVETIPKLFEPKGRAIFAGIMSLMSLTMASHAGSQAEASEKRADLLRKMRDDFVAASGALNSCKSEDRSDTSKPTCYCYTPDNQRNSNRTASQICQKLWTGLNQGTALATDTTSSDKICITKLNQPDPSCACKANNTCMKVTLNNLKGISTGTMSMLNSAIEPLNKVVSGTVGAANLDSAALSNQAMNMQKAIKSLENNKNTKDLIKDKAKQEGQLLASLNKASAGLGSNDMLGSTGSSGMPTNPGEAAVMLEKELDGKGSSTSSSENLSETVVAPSSNEKTETLEFGLTADQAAAQETQIAEVMKKDLDYGGNDINQGSKTNIFEVLSNRYQRSGMRRLFDEKGKTQADKASTTDITQ